MTAQIHPTAIIAATAILGARVSIGPYCVIGPNVVLGDNCNLHSHVVIDGFTTIGEGCEIFPFAVLGKAPQDLKFKGEQSKLIIGARNKIREHVTMQPGTASASASMSTIVGDDGLYMVGVHVAHDCVLGNRVIMANNATLAGHVTIEDGAIIGGLSAIKQFVRIGQNAMIGGMSGVENDVIPFGLVMGERAHLAGLNLVGLERRGLDKASIGQLRQAFKDLFLSNDTVLSERLNQVMANYADDQFVQLIISFIKAKAGAALCLPNRN
jgi:UDP-N-acetylglucosamine acyltransferase